MNTPNEILSKKKWVPKQDGLGFDASSVEVPVSGTT